MTHLERFKRSIRRERFDRIPFSIHMTPEMAGVLTAYTGHAYDDLVYQVFDADRRSMGPVYIGPEPALYDDGSYDNVFGVRMREVRYDGGVYSEAVSYPLARAETVAAVERYSWPKADWYDYDTVLKSLDSFPDYPFTLGYHALGWYAWEMRGMSKFLEDLYLEESIATAIIRAVSDFGYAYFTRLIETAKGYADKNFAAIHIADDWGTQNGLLISVEMFRKYFKPHYRRIIDLAHSAGVLVEFHCCGSQIELIPDFINLGVDILNPVQTSAKGMSPAVLKREYGGDIAFSGGVDVQTVLPNGTPQTVRNEVFMLLDTLGRDGGYILEPSHAIQVGTPPENVVAMVDAVYEYYGMTKPAKS